MAPTAQALCTRTRIVELASRWYVFWFLNVYGIGKIAGGQFYRHGHLPPEVAQMTLGAADPFDLAWTFMGSSFAYILFIGLAEIIGAWLLLWEKTKLIGVAILLPVMINILAFDIVFLDKYGALASAAIYTALLFVILACNRNRALDAIRTLILQPRSEHVPFGAKLKRALLAFGLMSVLFAFDQILVNLLGHGRG